MVFLLWQYQGNIPFSGFKRHLPCGSSVFAVPVYLPGRGAADLYFLSFQDGDPPETGVPSEIGGGKKEKYLQGMHVMYHHAGKSSVIIASLQDGINPF